MKLTITINLDNDAFVNADCTPTDEVARILAGIGRSYPFVGMREEHNVRDINGNTVGQFVVTP